MTEERSGLSRRRFLAAAAGAGVAAAMGGAAASLLIDGVETRDTGTPAASTTGTAGRGALIDFEGAHQAGILRPAIPQRATLVAAFDSVARTGRPWRLRSGS